MFLINRLIILSINGGLCERKEGDVDFLESEVRSLVCLFSTSSERNDPSQEVRYC